MKKNVNNKRGITLTSLIIYIVMFSAFTAFASATSTNLNEKLFDNRGEAINYSSLNKLQYNLQNTALDSTNIQKSANGEIIFSSDGITTDKYSYDNGRKIILKNDGLLCQNVESFESTVEDNKLTLQVKFNKYLNEITKDIVIYTGE